MDYNVHITKNKGEVMINQVRKDALSKNLQERFQAAIRKGDLELVSLVEGEADYLGIDLWITV